MDYGSHFYLTLPSNSKSYPDNTLDDFQVRLPEQIKLEENWEVALAEITYPHTWWNVRTGDFFLEINFKDFGIMRIDLPPNYYADPDEVIGTLNMYIGDFLETAIAAKALTSTVDYKIQFSYSNQLRKVVLFFPNPSIVTQINFSPSLAQLLGFNTEEELPKGKKIFSKFETDVDVSFVAMYIYCDLLPNLIIGDALAPLLRTVNVEGKHNDVICRSYDIPHYLPLARREFSTIRITIKDDTGQPLRFQWGKVVIKLHFRRQRFLA